MTTDDQWFSVPEAAEYLGVAATTLYRWIDRNVIETTTSAGGRVRLQKADLDSLATRTDQLRRNVPRTDGN